MSETRIKKHELTGKNIASSSRPLQAETFTCTEECFSQTFFPLLSFGGKLFLKNSSNMICNRFASDWKCPPNWTSSQNYSVKTVRLWITRQKRINSKRLDEPIRSSPGSTGNVCIRARESKGFGGVCRGYLAKINLLREQFPWWAKVTSLHTAVPPISLTHSYRGPHQEKKKKIEKKLMAGIKLHWFKQF